MKSLIAAVALSVFLTGCIVVPSDEVAVQYEPVAYVGLYPLGYYNGFGYWDGERFDGSFYFYGHRGYGHYYRGAPRGAYRGYHRHR